LRLDDQLDAGTGLELFGEVALLAEGDDVVVKAWRLLSQMMATPKAVYLRPVLDVRLVAELLTVPKKVMVCWVCMVFLLLPGQSGHIPKGAKVRCSQVAA
jgi:hypothetical protein